jgi:hypothetical protein
LIGFAAQDRCPDIVHLVFQWDHVPLDAGLEILQRCDLIRRKAQLGLVRQGNLDVFAETWTQPVQTQPDSPSSPLSKKWMNGP